MVSIRIRALGVLDCKMARYVQPRGKPGSPQPVCHVVRTWHQSVSERSMVWTVLPWIPVMVPSLVLEVRLSRYMRDTTMYFPSTLPIPCFHLTRYPSSVILLPSERSQR